jgi:hypothetical protein
MYLQGQSTSRRKALVILPSAVKIGYQDEIFNPVALNNPDTADSQCTNDLYLNKIAWSPDMRKDVAYRKAKGLIQQRYTMKGYEKFANDFEKEIIRGAVQSYDKKDTKRIHQEIVRRIRKEFENQLIIVDEVQNIRMNNQIAKNSMVYLEMIARWTSNARIILMSATPMYNTEREILPILNILLLNEKRAPIPEHVVFSSVPAGLRTPESGTAETFDGTEILRMFSSGLITYLRGEDPAEFPIKLYPESDELHRELRPIKDIFGKEIPLDSRVVMPLVRQSFKKDSSQENFYNDKMEFFEKTKMRMTEIAAAAAAAATTTTKKKKTGAVALEEESESTEEENVVIMSLDKNKELIFASNIVFPVPESSLLAKGDGDVDVESAGSVGDKGFDSCFTETPKHFSAKGLFTPRTDQPNVIDEESGKLFLDLDVLENYSMKFKKLIESIEHTEGSIFIYTENVKGSLLPLAMALEMQGYTRYNDNPLLNWKDKQEELDIGKEAYRRSSTPEGYSFKPRKYAILTGDRTYTKHMADITRITQSPDNANGEKIKVILATRVVAEGVNFRSIREIHVLDAYYHISRLDQIIGRGIRYCSHKYLPIEKHNVSIYLWAMAFRKEDPVYGGYETLDDALYRLSEMKSKRIAKVSRILKENAFDCHLIRGKNFRQYPDVLDMIDSKGKHRPISTTDIEGSRECDYSSCVYQCSTEEPTEEDQMDSTTAFFSNDSLFISELKHGIRDIFEVHPMMKLNHLIVKLMKLIPGIQEKTIEGVIYDMILNETRIRLPTGGLGVLQYRKTDTATYIVSSPVEIADSFASYEQRIQPLEYHPKEYRGAITGTESMPLPSVAQKEDIISSSVFGDAVARKEAGEAEPGAEPGAEPEAEEDLPELDLSMWRFIQLISKYYQKVLMISESDETILREYSIPEVNIKTHQDLANFLGLCRKQKQALLESEFGDNEEGLEEEMKYLDLAMMGVLVEYCKFSPDKTDEKKMTKLPMTSLQFRMSFLWFILQNSAEDIPESLRGTIPEDIYDLLRESFIFTGELSLNKEEPETSYIYVIRPDYTLAQITKNGKVKLITANLADPVLLEDGLYTNRSKNVSSASKSKSETIVFKVMNIIETQKSERECKTPSNVDYLPDLLKEFGSGFEDILERDPATNKILVSSVSSLACCIILELATRIGVDSEGKERYYSPPMYQSMKIQNALIRKKAR